MTRPAPLVFAALIAAIFVDQSAAGVLTSTLPFAVGTFDATVDDGTLLRVFAYSAYFAAIVVTPALVRRFGPQRTLWGALWGCAIAAATVAVADAFAVFACARVVFGAAQGALFVCAVMLLIRAPWPHALWMRIAALSVTSLGGPALAPLIAGVATDTSVWRPCFAAIALVALLAVGGIGRASDPLPTPPARVDLVGPAAFLGALACIELAVQFGPQWDWLADERTRDALGAAVAFAAVFLAWSIRTRTPAIRLRPFLHRNVAVAMLLAFTLGVPLFSIADLLSFVIAGLGFTPTEGGVLLALRLVPIVVLAPMVTFAMVVRGVDQRVIVPIAMTTTAFAYAIGAVRTATDADFGSFVLPVVLTGAGFSGLFSPIASLVISSVPPEDFPDALAAFKFALAVAGPTSTPLIATFLDHRTQTHLAEIAGQLDAAHLHVAGLGAQARTHLAALAGAQAQTMAYADVTLLVAAIGVLAAPLALFMRRAAPPPLR